MAPACVSAGVTVTGKKAWATSDAGLLQGFEQARQGLRHPLDQPAPAAVAAAVTAVTAAAAVAAAAAETYLSPPMRARATSLVLSSEMEDALQAATCGLGAVVEALRSSSCTAMDNARRSYNQPLEDGACKVSLDGLKGAPAGNTQLQRVSSAPMGTTASGSPDAGELHQACLTIKRALASRLQTPLSISPAELSPYLGSLATSPTAASQQQHEQGGTHATADDESPSDDRPPTPPRMAPKPASPSSADRGSPATPKPWALPVGKLTAGELAVKAPAVPQPPAAARPPTPARARQQQAARARAAAAPEHAAAAPPAPPAAAAGGVGGGMYSRLLDPAWVQQRWLEYDAAGEVGSFAAFVAAACAPLPPHDALAAVYSDAVIDQLLSSTCSSSSGPGGSSRPGRRSSGSAGSSPGGDPELALHLLAGAGLEAVISGSHMLRTAVGDSDVDVAVNASALGEAATCRALERLGARYCSALPAEGCLYSLPLGGTGRAADVQVRPEAHVRELAALGSAAQMHMSEEDRRRLIRGKLHVKSLGGAVSQNWKYFVYGLRLPAMRAQLLLSLRQQGGMCTGLRGGTMCAHRSRAGSGYCGAPACLPPPSHCPTLDGVTCPIIILTGPPASGKSTVIKGLRAALADKGWSLLSAVSHTTRSPRPGEADGQDYHFVSRAQFDRLAEQRAFFEHSAIYGNAYGKSVEALLRAAGGGAPAAELRQQQEARRVLVMDLHVSTVHHYLRRLPRASPLVFMLTAPIDAIDKRLRKRSDLDGGKGAGWMPYADAYADYYRRMLAAVEELQQEADAAARLRAQVVTLHDGDVAAGVQLVCDAALAYVARLQAAE